MSTFRNLDPTWKQLSPTWGPFRQHQLGTNARHLNPKLSTKNNGNHCFSLVFAYYLENQPSCNFGIHLKPPWINFGSNFANLSPKWTQLGPYWAHFRPTWDQLGHFWCHLGDYFGCLGSISALTGDVNTKPCSCKHEVVQL